MAVAGCADARVGGATWRTGGAAWRTAERRVAGGAVLAGRRPARVDVFAVATVAAADAVALVAGSTVYCDVDAR